MELERIKVKIEQTDDCPVGLLEQVKWQIAFLYETLSAGGGICRDDNGNFPLTEAQYQFFCYTLCDMEKVVEGVAVALAASPLRTRGDDIISGKEGA